MPVTEGRLSAGLPYLRLGQGPPLVMALGRAADHASPADEPDSWWPLSLVGVLPEGHSVVVPRNREAQAAATHGQRASVPPRWFVVLFWHGHRGLLRVTRGRLGLWRPKPDRWGALRLTTTGRRTGRPRQVVVGYFEDGRNLITMAMNGWGVAEPAWWLNLQVHPGAIAQTRDGTQPVRARRAQGDERKRLWSRWAEIDKNLDAYAARRPMETAVVVLEPQDTAGPAAGPAAKSASHLRGDHRPRPLYLRCAVRPAGSPLPVTSLTANTPRPRRSKSGDGGDLHAKQEGVPLGGGEEQFGRQDSWSRERRSCRAGWWPPRRTGRRCCRCRCSSAIRRGTDRCHERSSRTSLCRIVTRVWPLPAR
jgi:F420H(2)-dependent quinone reductase